MNYEVTRRCEFCNSHGKQIMTCLCCWYIWVDCPGAYGLHFKDGCQKCGSLYWEARNRIAKGKKENQT